MANRHRSVPKVLHSPNRNKLPEFNKKMRVNVIKDSEKLKLTETEEILEK